MAMLNKASNKITEIVLGDKQYLFYEKELVAYADPERKCYYMEPEHMKKSSVLLFIRQGYRFKHGGYTIEQCYCLNNLI